MTAPDLSRIQSGPLILFLSDSPHTDRLRSVFYLDGVLWHRMEHEPPNVDGMNRYERNAARRESRYMKRPEGVRGRINLCHIDPEANELVMTRAAIGKTEESRMDLFSDTRWVGDIAVVEGNTSKNLGSNRLATAESSWKQKLGLDGFLTEDTTWGTFDFLIYKSKLGRDIALRVGADTTEYRAWIAGYEPAFTSEQVEAIPGESYELLRFDTAAGWDQQAYVLPMDDYTYFGPNLAFSTKERADLAKELLS